MKKHFIIALLSCLIFFSPAHANYAVAGSFSEYDVKTAILFKLLQFIEWPEKSAEAIKVCVLGKDDFGSALALIEKQNLNGTPLRVSRGVSDAAAASCNILIIGKSEESRLAQIMTTLNQKPVLTVSDAEGFVGHGGMIGFVTTNKVNFEINNAAVKRANLRIDARVLELASNVIDK